MKSTAKLVFLTAAIALGPSLALAGETGDTGTIGPMSSVAPASSRAGRAGQAQTELSFSLGYLEPRGDSELWKTNSRDFSLSPEDLGGATVGARVGSVLGNNVALDVGLSYYEARERSAYSLFTTSFGGSIDHNTRLQMLPVTIDVRFMPFGRYSGGTSRGQGLNRVIPYIGFGGGAILWKYREKGDFIDFGSLTVFNSKFSSRGIAPEYHGFVGADVVINPDVSLFVEGRLSRSDDDLSSDFQGFDELDLSSDTIQVGTRIRF